MLHLMISHRPLSSALRMVMGPPSDRESRGEMPAQEGPVCRGDVVVTTTADTSPSDCRQLADLGARVVILTPLRTNLERSRYALAGAVDYIEMTADASALIDAVTAATAAPAVLLDAR